MSENFYAGERCSRALIGAASRRRPWCQWTMRLLGLPLILLALYGGLVAHAAGPSAIGNTQVLRKSEESRMWMTVGERRFAITLADTDAARAFSTMLPLTLDMEDLNGNEKKKDLSTALPANAKRPGTIHSGDLMLWGARTVVVFYLTFDSPYAYTHLGRVDDPAGVAQALGSGDVRVIFSRN